MKKSLFAKITLFVLMFALLCTGFACGSSEYTAIEPSKEVKTFSDVKLVSGGVSDYKIVIPEDVSSPERGAAEELVRIFNLATGYTLPVVADDGLTFNEEDKVISIGNTSIFEGSEYELPTSKELNYDGFIIKREGNTVLLNTNNESAYYYAVYELCEQNFNYRWYGFDCEKYDVVRDINLIEFSGENEKFVPDFSGRHVMSFSNFESPESKLHLRSNNQGTGMGGAKGDNSYWGSLHDQSFCMQLLNAGTYYQDHPEWYYFNSAAAAADSMTDPATLSPEYADEILANGQSSKAWQTVKNYVQLCFTHALETIDTPDESGYIIVETLKQYIVNEPTKSWQMLGISDNREICNCQDCKDAIAQYTYTGVVARFVNAIAERITDWQESDAELAKRDITLCVFAYLETEQAPVKLNPDTMQYEPIDDSVIYGDKIAVRIAPIVSCHYKPFLDPRNEGSYAMFTQWSLCAKRFAIWDYSENFRSSIDVLPTWNAAQANYRMYKEIGVEDVMTQANGARNVTFEHMDNYVRQRMLWDLDLNYQDLAYDFMRNYFSVAGEEMIEFFNIFVNFYQEKDEAKSGGITVGIYNENLGITYLPMDVLVQMEKVFDRAYAKADTLPANERAQLYARLDRESSWYRFALIDLYGETYYTADELAQAISEYASRPTICSEGYKNTAKADVIAGWKTKYGI